MLPKVLLSAVVVLLIALCVILGQNADQRGAAVFIGAIVAAFVSIPISLGIALIRRESQPRRPVQQVMHQHLHVYQLDAQGQAREVSETTRSVVKTR